MALKLDANITSIESLVNESELVPRLFRQMNAQHLREHTRKLNSTQTLQLTRKRNTCGEYELGYLFTIQVVEDQPKPSQKVVYEQSYLMSGKEEEYIWN